MTRKTVWIVAGVVVLAIVVPTAVLWARATALEREYREQLSLARKEGLPATGEEFAALLPPVRPEENAAPIYQELEKWRKEFRSYDPKLDTDLNFQPTVAVQSQVRELLTQVKPALGLLDEAAKLPHCRFKRRWSDGIAILMPEMGNVKSAVRLLLLRGSHAASQGRSDAALDDARKALKIAGHLEEDRLSIAILVARSIRLEVLKHLSWWSFNHRKVPGYRQEIQAVLDGLALPNLKAERRLMLAEALSVIELTQTEAGRQKLGLKPGDIGAGEKVLPLLQSRAVGRIKVVKAVRAYWAALDEPDEAKMVERTQNAESELSQGMISFPTAAKVLGLLTGGGGTVADEIHMVKARKVAYAALLRALNSADLKNPIKTDDLLSPWDGKPVKYRFDGRQIQITVGMDPSQGDPLVLTVPPKPIADSWRTKGPP